MTTGSIRLAAFGVDHPHVEALVAECRQLDSYAFVGIHDPDPVALDATADKLGVPEELRFGDWEELVERQHPTVATVCSTTSAHADWAERLAPRGVHVLLEKPFAVDLQQAHRAVTAADTANVLLGVNWPIAWYASHRTAARLVFSGAIGEIVEVHYYNGNRGAHRGRSPAELRQLGATPAADRAWWFDAQRGGGALHDYLGYGATFGTWFRGGLEPTEVLAMQHTPDGYPVDLQVAVLARYTSGLSTLQARWGTFTDPWETQPQPGCGFVIVGDEGTIQSLDLQSTVRVQTAQDPKPRELAVDELRPEERGPLAAIASAVRGEAPIPRPLDVGTGLAGQRLVDAAVESIRTGTPVRPDTLGGARP